MRWPFGTKNQGKTVEIERGRHRYIFGKNLTVIDLRSNRDKPGVAIKRLVIDVAKVISGQVAAAIPVIDFIHESEHAATTIALGGVVKRITFWPPGSPEVGVQILVDSADKAAMVFLMPSIIEAVLGIYLIRLGLKKESAIAFSVGALSFTLPIWRFLIWNVIATRPTDYTGFAYAFKQWMIDNRLIKIEDAEKIDNTAIMLITLLAIYTAVLLGSKYGPAVARKMKKTFGWLMARRKLKKMAEQGEFRGMKFTFEGEMPLDRKEAQSLLKLIKQAAERAAEERK